MISALSWIPKGVAKSTPGKYELTEEQYQNIMQRANEELEDAREGLEEAKKQQKEMKLKKEKKEVPSQAEHDQNMMAVDESLAKFNLQAYDEEDGGVFDAEGTDEDVLDLFMQDVKGMVKSSSDDPYLSKEPVQEDEQEDADDLRIRPNDSLVVACKTSEEVSYLEIHLYEEGEDNTYVHHDIMLPTFPLCVEPIYFPFKDPSNESAFGCHAAVGTFDPEIEIWDLDVLDAAYPAVILGPTESGPSKSKKKSTRKVKNPHRHVDAVMSLAWNKQHRNMLLSGSADSTVKLWDLSTAQAIRSFEHHTDKVQVVQWNPTESSHIITGSYDGSITLFDARSPSEQVKFAGLLSSDIETLKWNPHQASCFAIGEENGLVHYVDSRNQKSLFQLQAHPKSTTSLDWHPTISNCLLTGSVDKSFKVWKVQDNIPVCVLSREPGIGKLFSSSFCPDSSFLVAAAGSKGEVRFFNLATNEAIVEAFSTQPE